MKTGFTITIEGTECLNQESFNTAIKAADNLISLHGDNVDIMFNDGIGIIKLVSIFVDIYVDDNQVIYCTHHWFNKLILDEYDIAY